MHLFDIFEYTAASQPNKPAFIYYSPRTKNWDIFTYQQFADSTNRFLLGLQACSLTPNMTAAVMTPPSIEFFPFAFAMLKLGIIPIILDPAIGLKKVSEILKESQPEIFIGAKMTHALRIILGWGKDTIKHSITIDSVKSKKLKSEILIPQPSSPIPNSPAAVIYTSGSTGLPKGAVYTQTNLAAQLTLLQQTFHITPDEIDLPAFPLYALIDVLLGVTSVIPDVTFPIPRKTNPEKIINAIQQFNVTNMFASPVVLDLLSSFALSGERTSSPVRMQSKRDTALRLRRQTAAAPLRVNLSSLKRIITAGAPATIPLQEKFRNLLDDKTELFGIYGATETLPIAKIESREIFEIREKTEHGSGVCLGTPIDDVTVRIIPITDEAIEEWQDSLTVEANVIGEITVQSAATTRSYIQREDANRLSKIKIGDEIIHRMGDVGYFDEEGRLWYCGRKSHRVITDDGVLFTEQIENIFNAHPQVNRTALVGVKGKPALWVEMKKGAKENKDKIKQELTELAKFHPQASKIKAFLFTKKFPTDVRHNSKIIREELTMLAEKRLL